MNLSCQQILNLKESLEIRSQAFINGKYVNSCSGKTYRKISPIDGSAIAQIAECDENDVDDAVQCAQNSFWSGVWRRMDPVLRKKVLFKFADFIEKNALELAILETIDMGKPISDSYREVHRSADTVRWFSEAIDKLYGSIATSKYHTTGLITREPVGVVGAITPWNYPLLMAVWKIAPALAAGNSVVLKPAEQSPLTAIRIAALGQEAGIPDGVLNVIPGYGEIAGKALATHNDVHKIAFTGSTEVGKLILQYSGQSNMKRVSLECGGKSPNIVFADAAEQLDFIAQESVSNMFYNSGQVCDAPTRLLVERPIMDRFISGILHYCKMYQPGNPLNPETRMGPVVDERQMLRVLDYIRKGKEEGARLCYGGNQVLQDTGGYYIEPTVFTDVNNSMIIARDEIFGPVLSVIPFDTTEEAVEIANDTDYGLCAMIWTNDIHKAHRVSKDIDSGKVYINCMGDGNISVPHGGIKQSGFGRDKSLEAFEQYTYTKLTWTEFR